MAFDTQSAGVPSVHAGPQGKEEAMTWTTTGFSWTARLLIAASVVGLAACGGSHNGSGAGGGSAGCRSDIDCKGDRICDNGECVSPAVSTTATTPGAAGSTGTGGTSATGMGNPLYAPCQADGDCTSNFCDKLSTKPGFCTTHCSSDQDCGVDAKGGQNRCLGSGLCIVGCEDNVGACIPIGDGVCTTLTDKNGSDVFVCNTAHAPGILGVGDACNQNSDCDTGNCVGWCTKSCSTNQDCAGNQMLNDEFGEFSYCLQTSQGNLCFAGCGHTLASCGVYNNGTTCKDVGSGIEVCSN